MKKNNPYYQKYTHMVVLNNTIKFRGTLSQCLDAKKKLARIHGNFALKVVPIYES
jgi:hypothetical protein